MATVVTQNIVRSATWLLFTLAGVAGVFFLLGADLVGAIQILVYVGGTLVLVVFGVMLTAQGPFINMKASSAEWAISAMVGSLLLGVLIVCVNARLDRSQQIESGQTGNNMSNIAEPVFDFAPKASAGRRTWRSATTTAQRSGRVSRRRRRPRSQRGKPVVRAWLSAAVRTGVGASAGRADRRGVPGPGQTAAAGGEVT